MKRVHRACGVCAASSSAGRSGWRLLTTPARALLGAHCRSRRCHVSRSWCAGGLRVEGHIAADFIDMTCLSALRATWLGRTARFSARFMDPVPTRLVGDRYRRRAAEIAHSAGGLSWVSTALPDGASLLTRLMSLVPIGHGPAHQVFNRAHDVIASSTSTGARGDDQQAPVAGRSGGGAILATWRSVSPDDARMRTLFVRRSARLAAPRSATPRRWRWRTRGARQSFTRFAQLVRLGDAARQRRRLK